MITIQNEKFSAAIARHGVVDFKDGELAFEKKPGMMPLPASKTFETFYSVRVLK